MKLHGTDLISRATQNTFRSVLVFSAAALAISEFGLDSKVFDFFEVAPTAVQQQWIVMAIVGFMLISHLVHWFSDYVIYSSWFKSGDAPNNHVFGHGAFTDREHIFSTLKRNLDEFQKAESAVGIRDMENRLQGLERMLSGIGPGFMKMKWTTRCVVFGWYLGLPLVVGSFAILRARMIGV